MVTADLIANPADFIGPVVTCLPPPHTISAEPWTGELASWLLLRGLDLEPGPRVVVRRDGFIHAVLDRTGPDEALPHIAARVAGTWDARLVEVRP